MQELTMVNEFVQSKQHTLAILTEVLAILEEGQILNLNIDKSYFKKVEMAISELEENTRLKVVLVGGFSEGKTSIAAAWISKLDKKTMKISHEESSNNVVVYHAGDVDIIDTPGLFGFKEHHNLTNDTIEKYKDITKKYVSEAHILLYVMDSSNPIKNSHKEELTWLFKELDLLSRTIFVLSRFDEVADVEDEECYQKNLTVKSQNVGQRLNELIGLTAEEKANLQIIAVSANPFGEGEEYWLNNLEEFNQLSRIPLLQQATKELIVKNGGIANLTDEVAKSIIKDILSKFLYKIKAFGNDTNVQYTEISKIHNRLQETLLQNKHLAETKRIELNKRIEAYFDDIILQTNGTSIETFDDFFKKNISTNGEVIHKNLQNIFQNELHSINNNLENLHNNYKNDLKQKNNLFGVTSNMAVEGSIYSSLFIDNSIILGTRDLIVGMADFATLDLSSMLLFEPWGAIHLAGDITGVLSVFGIAQKAKSTIKEIEREKAFENYKAKLNQILQQQKQVVLNIINKKHFIKNCVPQYIQLEEQIQNLDKELETQKIYTGKLNQWLEKAIFIERKFKRNILLSSC